MSEELLLNDRRGNLIQINFSLWVQKTFQPPGFEPLTSRSTAASTNHRATNHLPLLSATDFILATRFTSEQ